MYATVIGDRWWKVEAWQRNQWVLADQGVLLVWIRLDNSSSTPYLFRDCISHIALGMFNLLPSGAGLPAQKLTLDTISQAANESSGGKRRWYKMPSQALQLANDEVYFLGWKAMNIMVENGATQSSLSIHANASGFVKAGEMSAIIGPLGLTEL